MEIDSLSPWLNLEGAYKQDIMNKKGENPSIQAVYCWLSRGKTKKQHKNKKKQ